jgi:hypothetical protein
MTGAGLQKYFRDVKDLLAHTFFNETGLNKDVADGEVFPAIRKNEVHFYYGGARLCVYKGKQMYTNKRYLGIREGKSRDVRIPEGWYTPDNYGKLKETCKGWRPPERELSIVSKLFPAFSIAASQLPAGRAWLLDIECRFPCAAGAEKTQDMIDCLFLTPDGALVFIEMKRTGNEEARGGGQGEPAVAGQLRRYRRQLGSEALREEIKDIYAGATDTLGRILGRELPAPRTVFKSVPLLIVGPSSSPSPGAKEVWQRDLLAAPLSLDSEIIGIDGRNGRESAALEAFFRAFVHNRVEAASQ